MGYVKQRADLLADNLAIPLFDNWDDVTTDQKSFKHIELDYWLPSYGQDDDGHVFTPLGIFLSIDLDYRDTLDPADNTKAPKLYIIVYHASDNEYESDWTWAVVPEMTQALAEKLAVAHCRENYSMDADDDDPEMDNVWYESADTIDGYKITLGKA